MLLAWALWGHVVIATLLTIPVGWGVAHLLTRARERSNHPEPARTAYVDVFIVIGTAPWIWMILTPGDPSTPGRAVGLVPFHDLAQVVTGPASTAFVQVGGNLLVFAALGALLPLRSQKLARLKIVAAVAAAGSLTVELLQYGLELHRVSSVDDILLNTTGAVLAAAMTQRWWSG
ncbi:VanZ family protein [Herbidospora sp. RD11066]